MARKASLFGDGRAGPRDADQGSVASAAPSVAASAATSAAATAATAADAAAVHAARTPSVADPRDVRDAVRYGRKAPRDDGHWLYTHRGQCYLTDALSRRCLATWEAAPAAAAAATLDAPDDAPAAPAAAPLETLEATSRSKQRKERQAETRQRRADARREQESTRLAAAAAAEAERAEQAALKERAKARAKEAAKARAKEEEAAKARAKEAADKARAKEEEKRRRAAASAKAAEADAERSRAETARRDEAAAREAAVARSREDAASQRAERQAARLRQRAAAEVVVEEEEDDEAAVAERLRRQEADAQRAAVERSRREAQEARDRARRVERARREAAVQAKAATLARERGGMAREDAHSRARGDDDACAREAALAVELRAGLDGGLSGALLRRRGAVVAAVGLAWASYVFSTTYSRLVCSVAAFLPLLPLWRFLARAEAEHEARVVAGAPPADRRRLQIARVLDLDDARKANYAAPEAACEAANEVLRATVELLSWDDFVRRGLLVETRDGSLDWVDDDPDALRAGLERAVADLAEHAARAKRAAAGCRAAAAELGSTFDGFARNVLGVGAADGAEVRRAARRLSLSCHPDKLRGETRGLRLRAARTFDVVGLARDALADDADLAATEAMWARGRGLESLRYLAPMTEALEALRAEIKKHPVAKGVRRRLKRFTHIVTNDGDFEKVLVPEEDLEAIGLWRDKFQRRDVYASHKRFGPGKGFAHVAKTGWLVRFYVVDPVDEFVYDVTTFITHRFHDDIKSMSNDDLVRRFSFTLGVQPLTVRASRELWARRLGAPGGAGGGLSVHHEDDWGVPGPIHRRGGGGGKKKKGRRR